MMDKSPEEISAIQLEIELLKRRRQDIIDNPTCLTVKKKSFSSEDESPDLVDRNTKLIPISVPSIDRLSQNPHSYPFSSSPHFPKSLFEALHLVDKLSYDSVRQSLMYSNYTHAMLPFYNRSLRGLSMPMFPPGPLVPPRLYFSKEEVSPPILCDAKGPFSNGKRKFDDSQLTSESKRRKI